MSQHYFRTQHQGEPVTVLLGWDRPLGHVFMQVMRSDAAPGDGTLYSNMEEADPFGLDLDYFANKLNELGIAVPASMFEQTRLDQVLRSGNRTVTHEADGSFTSALA